MFAFVIFIAYWTNVEGAATTLRWCLLFAFVPLLIHFKADLQFKHLFIACSLGVGINSIFCLFQWFGYRPVVQIFNSPSGLFINGNILAEATALVIVGCIVYRLYYLLPLMVPAMLLPMQRASMIALVIVGMIAIKLNIKWKPLLCGIIISIIFSSLWLRSTSVQDRIELWTFATTHLNLFGHGINSFRTEYLNYFSILDNSYYIVHVHNDPLELIFDYGIFGGIFYVAIVLGTIFTKSPLKYVVLAFLIEGLFGFPLYMPTTLFIASLCFYDCLHNWDGIKFTFWSGRIYSHARNVGTRFKQIAIRA